MIKKEEYGASRVHRNRRGDSRAKGTKRSFSRDKKRMFDIKILGIRYSSTTRKHGRVNSRKMEAVVGNRSQNLIARANASHPLKNRTSIMKMKQIIVENARKKMTKICVRNGTVPHNFNGKIDGVRILILRSQSGVIQGDKTIRAMCEVVGITSLKVKIHRKICVSKKIDVFLKALKYMEAIQHIAKRRGKSEQYIRSNEKSFNIFNRLSQESKQNSDISTEDTEDMNQKEKRNEA